MLPNQSAEELLRQHICPKTGKKIPRRLWGKQFAIRTGGPPLIRKSLDQPKPKKAKEPQQTEEPGWEPILLETEEDIPQEAPRVKPPPPKTRPKWYVDGVPVPLIPGQSLDLSVYPTSNGVHRPQLNVGSNERLRSLLCCFDVRYTRIWELFTRRVPRQYITPRLAVDFARIMEALTNNYMPRAVFHCNKAIWWWLEQNFDIIELALQEHFINAKIGDAYFLFK